MRVGRVLTLGDVDATTPAGRPWTTGYLKEAVGGWVDVTTLGLAGDAVGDTKVHGGVNKAVLMYAADHYPAWQGEFDLPEFGPGAFGENLSVTGFDERDVCVGDHLRAGEVVFEVSQPREPCWKIDRRWGERGIAKRMAATGRSGWYLRVLHPGRIRNGLEVELIARPFPGLAVAYANAAVFAKPRVRDAAEAALACDRLSPNFRATVEGVWKNELEDYRITRESA